MDTKHLPTAILFFLLLCFQLGPSTEAISGNNCVSNYTEPINNRTRQIVAKYQGNLQIVLGNLELESRALSKVIFLNISEGEPPSKSYGMYLCRGDTTQYSICSACVSRLAHLATLNSTNCTENFVYDDDCIIHYANHSVLGTADHRLQGKFYDKVNPNSTLKYNQTLESVAEKVIREAAYKSDNKFAMSVAKVKHEGEKVYAVAQCTPDIDGDSCNGCLKAAQSHMQHDIPGGAKFAWAILTSCQLRYDNVSFFEANPATSNPAPHPISAVLVATLSLFFVNWVL